VVFRPRALRLPALVLGPTLLLTSAAAFRPAVLEALRRDPTAIQAGELWRLISPVLVQADALSPGGLWRTIAVFALVTLVLASGERSFGAARTVLLYLLGALVGHGIGELWQPYGAGCSVAGCGVLGALALWLVRARPPQIKLAASLVLACGIAATLLKDIHGPPLLAGALASVWMLRATALPETLR
jgi:rhomboid protease GluP